MNLTISVWRSLLGDDPLIGSDTVDAAEWNLQSLAATAKAKQGGPDGTDPELLWARASLHWVQDSRPEVEQTPTDRARAAASA